MDTEFCIPSGKQIVNAVYKSKRSVEKIKSDSVKYFMNLFMLNKQIGLNANLSEIRTMSPQQGYFFIKQVCETAIRVKEMRKKTWHLKILL